MQQGGTLPGSLIVNLGGGGDQNQPVANGGGNSIRSFQSCSSGTCQITEARLLRPHSMLRPGSFF